VAVTIVDSAHHVVGGVDTHRDVNVAAVVDMNGGLLGVESFPTTSDGHRCLSSWMSGFGRIEQVGIEGTGAYGAGLARYLAVAGVIEVDRPNRQKRRRHGKSDQLDAVEAARGRIGAHCRVVVRVAPSQVTRTPRRCGRCWSPRDRRVRRRVNGRLGRPGVVVTTAVDPHSPYER
jgi:transposase